jgi:putative ABC transport system permease protein
MTRVQLVSRNLSRNLRRTLLTGGSVAVSTLLLAVFCATYRYMVAPPSPERFNLILMVVPRVSLMTPLPLRYGAVIAKVPGVAAVSPVNMVDGLYGGQDALLWILACDPKTMLKARSDWRLPPDQLAAFFNQKTALAAGRKIAQKYGWKVGDLITIRSPGYHVSLELELRAIYSSPDDETLLAMNWEYLNDALGHSNKVGAFWVLPQTPQDAQRLGREIDALFRNADVETRTQSMKQFVLDLLSMLGNIQLILVGVSAAVVFAVLLIVANTMGMSIRERTAELAVMRALGFRTHQELGMLAAESLAISLGGALVGCVLAWLLLHLAAGYQMGGAMPLYIQLDALTVILALSVAAGISLLSTLLPAYRASRINIAQALRFVG